MTLYSLVVCKIIMKQSKSFPLIYGNKGEREVNLGYVKKGRGKEGKGGGG